MAQAADQTLKVWVLAGQSNMEGCGCLMGSASPDPRVMNFTSAGNWEVAEEPLHRLWESYCPVHQNLLREWNPDWTKDKSDEQLAKEANNGRTHGAGLGLPFGIAMADATGERIGLISCAHGGTSLDQWSPELAPEKGTASFFGAMVDRIKRAGGDLQGILWYQGESDCNETLAATYNERFTRWIEAARRETGMPDLPVIVVQLGCFVPNGNPPEGDAKSWDRMRDNLAELAWTVPNVAVVGAIDLGLVDLIHISTPGLMELGKRMAKIALRMKAGESYVSAPKAVTAISSPVPTASPWAGHGGVLVRCEGVKGGWQPKYHMAGFAIYDETGNLHPTLRVISANCCEADETAIHLLTNLPVDGTAYVGYGRGLAPYCNVVDAEGQGLLAFILKVEVEG